MARKFLTSISLEKNELQNFTVHKLATAPSTPSNAQVYCNTSNNRIYAYLNGTWKDISGYLDAITSADSAISLVEDGGTVTLSISNANGSISGFLPPALYTLLVNATDAATADTLVLRDENGDVSFSSISLTSGTISNAPTNPTDIANKAYVDSFVSSGIAIQGSIDASSEPNYPAATEGFAWYISVSGKIGGASGELVEAGDLLIAITTSAGGTEATVGSDFIIVQNNIDVATETVAGKIELATQAEVNAGNDTQRAVTPATLAEYVSANSGGGSYSESIGDGNETDIIVTHNLGTSNVSVTLVENATSDIVFTDINITSINTITVGFAVAPTVDQYKVIVQS